MPLDLEKYFNKIGIPKQLWAGLNPSVESLYFIVNKHVMAIPYQNFSLFFREKPIDMSVFALEKRLIHQNQGGMCYETSELLYHALSALKFNVRRTPAFILNNKPFNKDAASNHNVSIAIVENKFFLIDVGFGYNSLRYPLELNLNETYETSLFQNERYQLINAHDYLQLNIFQDNAWFSLYRINKPLEFIDFQNTLKNYHHLLDFKGFIPIRDSYIKAGVITSSGRECFHFEPRKESPPYSFRTTITSKTEKTKRYTQFIEFKKDLISTLDIQPLPDSKKIIEYETSEMQSALLRNTKKLIFSIKSKPSICFIAGLGSGAFLYDSCTRRKP